MAATLPLNIPIPQAAAIASYNYQDIAQAVGITDFYGAVANQTNGDQVLLSSAEITTSGDSMQTNAGTTALAFDSAPFNLARTAAGSGYISFGFGKQVSTATGSIHYDLLKYDGSTEATLITSGSYTIAAATTSGGVLIKFDVTNPTVMRKDDQLRLRMWVKTDTGGGDYIVLGHNPKNTDTGNMLVSASDTTALKVGVPFRVI